jgi:uncharacterized RDD family membrane protein YckC
VHPAEQIVTGEAVAVEMRLAGVGSRGVAAAIDLAIMYFAAIVLLLVLVKIGVAGLNRDVLATMVIVAEVGLFVGYPTMLETLWHGKTVGKAIMGLRVVRDDGGPIRFRHALVRALIGEILEKTGLSLGFLAFILILCGERHKRLGDLAAGTIVLQARVPSQVSAPIDMPLPLAGWAAGLDLTAVNDDLALRVRQFLGRANQLTPVARGTIEQQLVGEVVARVGPPPPETPPWATLAAVLAERRRRAFNHYAPTTPPPARAPSWGAAPEALQPPPNASPANLRPATTATSSGPPPPESTTGFTVPR